MSLVRGATLAAVVCVVASLAAAVPPAYSQDPGVVFEPGSPSSKEYAIPFEEARRDGGGARRRNGGYVPFGVGIGIISSGGSSTSTGGPAQDTQDGASADGREQQLVPLGELVDRLRREAQAAAASERGQGAGLTAERARALQERLADAEAASASLLWKLAPYLLVLLPGLIVGLLLARRGPRDPAT